MPEWDWFRYFVAALAAVGVTSETVKHVRTGVAYPMLGILAIEEFEREENAAFFWGIVAFNVLLGVGFISLLLFVMA